MEVFSYKAKDKSGETQIGSVEAPNEKKAVSLLRKKDLLVTSLVKKEKGFNFKDVFAKFKKVSFSDIVAFTRQLSTMTSAGLSLPDTLDILKSQFDNPALAKMIKDIGSSIESGISLSEALKKYPQHFSPIYISLVQAGEASGKINDVLERVSDNLEKERSFKSKLKGAMIYPTIVVTGMGAVVFIMMSFVIPKLTEMYSEFDIDLPLPTKILIGVSSIFSKFWWLILIFVFAGLFLFRSWKKTEFGKRVWDSFMLKLPVFGNINRKLTLVEFSRTLGILAGAGVPILESLNILSASIGNATYTQAIKKVAKGVERGFSIGALVLADPIFPPVFGQMVVVGEETGKLDETLMKISTYFEQEGDQAVQGLTTALEPIIMVILGVGVGFIVMSIILPIYNLTAQF
ncbi:type II secretion system F family protein [Candidatus Microgenomates bacterium]|nr:type II secretion system F family protein [Candidatus Microgenomates bacterium]